MNEEFIEKLLNMATKAAKNTNKAYNSGDDATISYREGYLDAIMEVLNLTESNKFYSYEQSGNYEEITHLKIKTINYKAKNYDKAELIKI